VSEVSKPNEVMIEEIRNKLNIVNPALINPEKFKNANQDDIADMHRFVMSKDTFSPSEVTAIADELGNLRHN
jgi:uncharacterized protein YfkK (UPF0435 family)